MKNDETINREPANLTELNFVSCIEGLVNIADYILALKGEKSQCGELDFIDPVSEDVIPALDEIQSELSNVLCDFLDVILKAKNIRGMYEDEDPDELMDIHELIIDKGEAGYSELLKICNSDHMDFGIIKLIKGIAND